jgi:hypothetical protein
MKIFQEPNPINEWKCIICGSGKKSPVTLIGIAGKEENGNIPAIQIHVECLNLTYFEEATAIVQLVKVVEND